MRFWTTPRSLLDLITESVACRSGILLTDHDVRSLVQGTPLEQWTGVFDRPQDAQIGIRPEFVEDFVRVLRAAIGNLPDATPGGILSIRRLKKLTDRGIDIAPVFDAINSLMDSDRYKSIGEEFVKEVISITGMPLEVVAEVVLALADHQERDSLLMQYMPAEWDGARPLSDLFSTETAPKDPERYFEQRFIDFLVAQGERLDKMHWRNFERLTAEYFHRNNYAVQLGPGSKDGGVDIRLWPKDSDRTLPPLMLIQCKRYKRDTLVELEYVKALWADVSFEGAQGGLIATTARISPDGKRIAEARKYPLSFAENASVRDWTRSMWRYSWDEEKRQTVGVGNFLLPPVLP
ncbi:restriction endonuclease [Corallococcus sp. CA054B]|uniref:restriction endonuclease n=1 Tax=Corallococcus sp. CA054B TaxID=2316734 RepID=UPI000EA3A8BC|nr:restriction endonuclease [Corallococcus sp. CA054B]RKG66344.1 restriction endonuclease [Corallococcus sp. CA054B]